MLKGDKVVVYFQLDESWALSMSEFQWPIASVVANLIEAEKEATVIHTLDEQTEERFKGIPLLKFFRPPHHTDYKFRKFGTVIAEAYSAIGGEEKISTEVQYLDLNKIIYSLVNDLVSPKRDVLLTKSGNSIPSFPFKKTDGSLWWFTNSPRLAGEDLSVRLREARLLMGSLYTELDNYVSDELSFHLTENARVSDDNPQVTMIVDRVDGKLALVGYEESYRHPSPIVLERSKEDIDALIPNGETAKAIEEGQKMMEQETLTLSSAADALEALEAELMEDNGPKPKCPSDNKFWDNRFHVRH